MSAPAPTRQALQPGAFLADRYVLGPRVRSTTFTEVHTAHDTQLDRDVWLTALRSELAGDPAAARLVAAGIAAAAELSHPGIMRIYDAGTLDLDGAPTPWAASEAIDGVSVDSYARPEELDDEQWAGVVLDLAGQLAAALQHAHSEGIVHGNLGPGTVLVAGTDPTRLAVKVVDLGPQAADLAVPADPDLTVRMWARFTAGVVYPSRELKRGHAPSRKSDVFGFGCVLAALLLTVEEPARPGSTAARLLDLARWARRKHRSDRPPSFRVVRDELARIDAARPPAPSHPVPSHPAPRPPVPSSPASPPTDGTPGPVPSTAVLPVVAAPLPATQASTPPLGVIAVRPTPPTAAPSPRRRRWWTAPARLLLLLVAAAVIAVLIWAGTRQHPDLPVVPASAVTPIVSSGPGPGAVEPSVTRP